MAITPVLLCGGSGTRLWPLSRKSYPKQFAPLLGDESLFQAAARRLSGAGYTPPLAITGEPYRFIVGEQLNEIGQTGTIVIEPEGRNTAPAILAAALWLSARQDAGPDALMLIAPSDHVIPDDTAFRTMVDIGVPAAKAGKIVTFGITPDRAETGYGWLEPANPIKENDAVALKRFVEKPDADTARAMLADGRYLWNAGLFLFSVQTILEAFGRHAPDLIAPVQAAVGAERPDLDFHRLEAEAWSRARDISLDYAVMEHADNVSVVPFTGQWSDLGDWQAVHREAGPDRNGVVLQGTSTAIDCENVLIRSEDPEQEVIGLGLENAIVVATRDAVLVADMSRSQEVKRAVDALRAKDVRQAVQHPRDYRPWGWYETLTLAERFQVKRIVVKPGARLSLQSHVHRAEHWIVVGGTAQVTVGDEVSLVGENESAYISLGAVHRLENPGKVPMILIEVQTGAYLGEDDITRYEDVYKRP